jgi:DNA-binding GntR family transcriptional regulator
LTPAGRRERIAEIVLGREAVAARELATLFDVSLMTVHRDLDELERQGVLRKIRGGATPQPSSLFESNVRYRLARRGQRRSPSPATSSARSSRARPSSSTTRRRPWPSPGSCRRSHR